MALYEIVNKTSIRSKIIVGCIFGVLTFFLFLSFNNYLYSLKLSSQGGIDVSNTRLTSAPAAEQTANNNQPCPIKAKDTRFEGATVSFEPISIENASPAAFLDLPFDVAGKAKLAEQLNNYIIEGNPNAISIKEKAEVWRLQREADIDNDMVAEQIYSLHFTMTQGPHYIGIAKKNRLIYLTEPMAEAQFKLIASPNYGPGFIIGYTYEFFPNNYKYIRYKAENGYITPVWEQYECTLTSSGNLE